MIFHNTSNKILLDIQGGAENKNGTELKLAIDNGYVNEYF